jgi:hypothetical protein
MLVKDGSVGGQVTLETGCCSRHDKFGVNMEFGRQLALPLLGQMRGAENRHPPHVTDVKHLAGNQGRFDGLTDPNVVGDQ